MVNKVLTRKRTQDDNKLSDSERPFFRDCARQKWLRSRHSEPGIFSTRRSRRTRRIQPLLRALGWFPRLHSQTENVRGHYLQFGVSPCLRGSKARIASPLLLRAIQFALHSSEHGYDAARRGFGGEPSPEVAELRKAIDDKASADVIKAKLAKVREVRKANEAKLEAAQEDLRKVLSVRQEAVALMFGLVK